MASSGLKELEEGHHRPRHSESCLIRVFQISAEPVMPDQRDIAGIAMNYQSRKELPY